MMYALQTLHNRGITVKETVYESIRNLNQWYEQSGNPEYLNLALLHMQAYANMGFAVDESDLSVQKVLERTGKNKDDFFPRGNSFGKRIRLNRAQVRSMFGKWKPTKDQPMTIAELVDDIINKVKLHCEGRYVYQYQRKKTEDAEVYELVINKEECYFYDVKNFRFYTFVEEQKAYDTDYDLR